MALTKKQQEEVRRLWSLDPIELDSRFDNLAFKDRSAVEFEVKHEMREEGKIIVDHAANLYGGEYLARLSGRLQERVEIRLSAYRSAITDVVCIKTAYCARRLKGDFEKEGWQLATMVADALLALHGLPFPVTTISVFLIKKGILDQWCGCGKKKDKSVPLKSA